MKKIINNLLWFYRRRIKLPISNFIYWFKTIINDADWDDHYIWVILEKKLIKQAKYISKKGIHVNAQRDAERMMTCVRLIQKVKEEWYRMEYMDYHKSEYHWDDVPDNPDSKQLRIEELSENFSDYFKKYPLVFKKIIITEKDVFEKNRIAMLISIENHKRAKSLLFKILDNHIEEWWN